MQAPAAVDPLSGPHVVCMNADDAPVLVPLPPPPAVLALPQPPYAGGPGAAFVLDVPASAVQTAISAPASLVAIPRLPLSAVVRSGDPVADAQATGLTLVRRPTAAAAVAVPIHVGSVGCPGIPVPHTWDIASIFEPNGSVYERCDIAAAAIGTLRARLIVCIIYILVCSVFSFIAS